MGHDFDSEELEFLDIYLHGKMVLPKDVKYINRNMRSGVWEVGTKDGTIMIGTDLTFKYKRRK